MPKASAELSKKRGDRVKSLLSGKMLQRELADAIGYEPEHLSAVLNGRRTLTEDAARAIADLFPPVRYQFLLCEDDYPTESDLFDAILSKHSDSYEKKITSLKAFSGLRGFEIMLYSSGMTIGPSGGWEDLYIIRRNGNQIFASYSDIMGWVDDVCDYVELKLDRIINSKRGTDNG